MTSQERLTAKLGAIHMSEMTLGSLFDGSGGFPLAGWMNGITPLWASEIEPFPIRVTRARFPHMKHLGNILHIDGSKIDPVDIITSGSPCQDLSLAGRRSGLDGSRSGLFHEAIRITKEMRRATNGRKPEFFVWENVPGAFSSNSGEDFRTVLEEICSVIDPEISLPLPDKGKWEKAGCVMGDSFSLAWRVLDAQYWGVPQRRKRIFLVADLGGGRAGKILFEPESLSGDSAQSQREEPETAGDSDVSSRETGEEFRSICLNDQGGQKMNVSRNLAGTLRASANGHQPIVLEHHPQDSRMNISKDPVVQALPARMGTGGGNVPLVMFWDGTQTCSTLTRSNADGSSRMPDKDSFNAILCPDRSSPFRFPSKNPAHPPAGTGRKDPKTEPDEAALAIRSLTPLECCRLQGFPDWWTAGLVNPDPGTDELRFWINVWGEWCGLNGKKPKTLSQIRKWLADPHKDSAEYRMWGNGVALPCVSFVLGSIARSVNSSIPPVREAGGER